MTGISPLVLRAELITNEKNRNKKHKCNVRTEYIAGVL